MFYEDSKKIGIGLIFLGLALFILGTVMFLDRGFLAIGNMSFLMGLVSLIGLKSTVLFFGKRSKLLGSFFFFTGFILIIIGWYMFTCLGYLCQVYGIFLLFRSFIATIFAYSQTLPIIGPFLRTSPIIHKAVNALAEDSAMKKKAKQEV